MSDTYNNAAPTPLLYSVGGGEAYLFNAGFKKGPGRLFGCEHETTRTQCKAEKR